MEFKRVQHHLSRQIIKWFVDGKKVNEFEYEYLENKAIQEGKKYNSSSTSQKRSNCNFIHTHFYN